MKQIKISLLLMCIPLFIGATAHAYGETYTHKLNQTVRCQQYSEEVYVEESGLYKVTWLYHAPAAYNWAMPTFFIENERGRVRLSKKAGSTARYGADITGSSLIRLRGGQYFIIGQKMSMRYCSGNSFNRRANIISKISLTLEADDVDGGGEDGIDVPYTNNISTLVNCHNYSKEILIVQDGRYKLNFAFSTSSAYNWAVPTYTLTAKRSGREVFSEHPVATARNGANYSGRKTIWLRPGRYIMAQKMSLRICSSTQGDYIRRTPVNSSFSLILR